MNYFVGALIGAGVYIASICSTESACYRVQGDGEKYWDFSVLWTEGLVGPLRTTKLLLKDGHYKGAAQMFFNTANPWFTIPAGALLGGVYGSQQR